MSESLQVLLTIGPFLLLLIAYFIGAQLEKRHFADIRQREAQHREFPVTSFTLVPEGWQVQSSALAHGSVVISVDYFKRVIAGLRMLFGGRIKTYEPLLERARREAVLRMIEDARGHGYDAVVNTRIETSRLASASRDGQATAGVEILAYGTALKRG